MKGQETLFSSANDTWFTPKKLFDELNTEFHFTLDPCTTPDNPLGLPNFFTESDDGLTQDWGYHDVFVNPPYSDTARWVEKFFQHSRGIMLIPARTDTKYWHEHIWPHASWLYFFKGRLKFSGSKNSAPFPSVLVAKNMTWPMYEQWSYPGFFITP